MKKLLLLPVLLILCLPLLVNNTQTNPTGAGVAYAGHTLIGGYCECGCGACICDPGDIPGAECANNRSAPVSDKAPAKGDRPLDLGSAGLMLGLFFMLLLRRFL